MKRSTYEIIIAVILTVAYIVTFAVGFLGSAFVAGPVAPNVVHQYLGGSWKILTSTSGNSINVITPGLLQVKSETLEDSYGDLLIVDIYTFNSQQTASQFFSSFSPIPATLQEGNLRLAVENAGLTYTIYAINGNTVIYLSYINGGITSTAPAVTQLIGLISQIS